MRPEAALFLFVKKRDGTMKIRINYSIIFVSDMIRSIEFYRDIVGIPLKFQSPGWTEFITEGATLALHKTDMPAGESSHDRLERPGQCRAGFQVADIANFHRQMIGHGVPCLQEPTETFGVKIAQYVDPDGLVFSVSGAPPTTSHG
jgi:lactoylglutathione lyase